MERKELLKNLVDNGRHARQFVTCTAVLSDQGPRPVGEFWDSNKTLDVIVNGAHAVHDTVRETDEYIHHVDDIKTGRIGQNDSNPITNIKALTNAQINSLKVGDTVIKTTGDEKHSYTVAYKKDNEMSLVYTDCWTVEEVYYEKNGDDWTYIQTDTFKPEDYYTKAQINDKFDDMLGVDANDITTLKNAIEDLNDGTGLLPTFNTKQDTLVSGTNIKTISGQSILGSGNLNIQAEVVVNEPMPADWLNGTTTMAQLVNKINADESVKKGKIYLGTVSNITDLPTGISQCEMTVQVMSKQAGKWILVFSISSADVSPYKWEYTAYNMGNGPWRSWLPSNTDFSDYVQKSQTAGLIKNDGTIDTNTYLTSHQDISGKADKTYVDSNFIKSSVSTPTVNNNGHDYVDLGLPSGILWATVNVGASSETGYGDYYMYGKTTTYNSSDSDYTGRENPLSSSADAASVNWGGDWHMPTKAQFEELIANTNYTWVTNYQGSGINGGLFTNKTDNSKVLFLPAAGTWSSGNQSDVGSYGYYWSSTPTATVYACNLGFGLFNSGVSNSYYNKGCLVRPVIEPGTVTTTYQGVTQAEKDSWDAKSVLAKPTYTAPTAISGLEADGTAQAVLNAGSTSDGTIEYSSDSITWSTTIPTKTEANTYTVYWRLLGDSTHVDVLPRSIEVTIAVGHDYVEIGGVKWATMNVGAESETDYGNYYMYGKGSTQYNYSDSAYTGTENPLATSADTATQEWGGNWRMPTKAEFESLIANTNYSWTTINNIHGGKFTSKTDSSKYVFFPAAGIRNNDSSPVTLGSSGIYWSSSSDDSDKAYVFYFNNMEKNMDYGSRSFGYSVRPVKDVPQS